eukprot:TRINITY_DN6467_c0_g1_i3.p2 TRINITY_DN6467_c0_g1~~TRINITY_DN6467_c0_g1_i3.p2  ORF type:complete len:230 (-),score=73.18 TRINITY_DN6467_c0_g1_i3:124-813(-)
MNSPTIRMASDGMKRLFLVRHGETVYNAQKKVQGNGIDVELNDVGRRQALALSRRLARERFDMLACSTLKRAVETMDAVRRHHPALPVSTFAQLEEMAYGDFEGKLFDPSSADHPDSCVGDLLPILRAWDAGRGDVRLPGGETPVEVLQRARSVIDQILADTGVRQALVVCHGRLLKVLLSSLLDFGWQRMNAIEQHNTAVNIVDFDPATGKFHAVALNSTEHLAEHAH